MIKAIFFDIDGTLMSFETHKIPESSLEALKTLRNNGIKLFVATGRHHSMIKFLDDLFEFDAYITLNGQYCYNRNEVIYKNSINKEDIELVVKQTKENLYASYFIKENGIFTNIVNDKVIQFSKETNTEIPEISDSSEALINEIYQLVVFLDKENEHILLDKASFLEATRWHEIFLDINPKGGSKSIGIDALIKHYDISLDETMAFGDGENDISMLKHVKIGVAMGNASDIVKNAADHTTEHIDNDGIIKALKHFNIL